MADRRPRSGFTLLEIMVTIAIIGLLSGLLIAGTSALLRERPSTPDEVLRTAIAEARRYAIEHYREVRLAYDNKEKYFLASTVDGQRRFPVDLPFELQIDFLAMPRGSAMLLGGVMVESASLPYVTFYSDGTCTPFRVQLRANLGAPWVTSIDPWTCAPVLETPK